MIGFSGVRCHWKTDHSGSGHGAIEGDEPPNRGETSIQQAKQAVLRVRDKDTQEKVAALNTACDREATAGTCMGEKQLPKLDGENE